MGAVIDPFARCGNPLTGTDHCGMPDRRDEFAVAAGLDPQNAETVLLIVVRDALDESRQHFRGGWVWLRFHNNCRVICFACAEAQSHSSASATPLCITTRAFHRQPARTSPDIGSP